ncbi:MAG TPA: VWA domain-containing protein [Pyrinomonadaceae bacterium]|jgi:Ca-activated chloride channel family protein
MKFARVVFVLFLVCFSAAGFAFSQDDAKQKDKKQIPFEVRANLNVLNASGNSDDVKLEDVKIFEDGVEQKVTYFAKKENVLNIGFVMDNTGSMRMRLGDTVNAGSAFIENLNAGDRAFIVRFVSSDKIEMAQDWTSNKTTLRRAMENLYIEGGQSAVIDGLYLAVEQRLKASAMQNPAQRQAIVLISDCEDRESYYNLQKLLAFVKGTDIQIFPIALTFDLTSKPKKVSENLANTLALETGGRAFILGNSKDKNNMSDAVKSIIAELRSPYVVGYASTNAKRDGSMRKLTIQIADSAKGEKWQGVIRESYVAPKD